MIQAGNIIIPIEILSKIFELVPQEDQINLRLVCKAFKNVFDDGYYLNGFKFKLADTGFGSHCHCCRCNCKYSQLPVLKVFKIHDLSFGNMQNKYKLEDLSFLYPEAVKNLTLERFMSSINFSIIMDQLTNLNKLDINSGIFTDLRHFHLASLKFDALKNLKITQHFCVQSASECRRMMDKIRIFLTQNEFPRLKKFEIYVRFVSRKYNQRIILNDDFGMTDHILFHFLKKCQKTITDLILNCLHVEEHHARVTFRRPVEDDNNLNQEKYKIDCPNLKVFKCNFYKYTKINPWAAFLQKNFKNLQEFDFANGTHLQPNYETIMNLFKCQNNAKSLEKLRWVTPSPYFSDIDFKFLEGFGALKSLIISPIELNGNQHEAIHWTFLNCKLISQFCPNLEFFYLGRRFIDSDSIDFLLNGSNLSALTSFYLLSKWRAGNGMRVETYKKVLEDKKIQNFTLDDCLNNESFEHSDNREYLLSNFGEEKSALLLQLIQNETPIVITFFKGNN